MSLTDPSSIEPLEGALQAGFGTTMDIVSIVVLLLLFASSALVSGSEAAFFSLSPAEKEDLENEEEKNKRAKRVLQLLGKPRELLATILITNNLVNVGIVILSSSIMFKVFQSTELSETLQFVIEVVVITLVLLLLGEVIPKVYATKNALLFAKRMATPLYRINKLPPISWIRFMLVGGISFIQKRMGKGKISISSDELEHALALTKAEDESDEEHKILEGIVKFGNTEVRQIMRSRLDVHAIEANTSFDEVMQLILNCGHSRLPVYEETFDKILGVLFIKDLLPHIGDGEVIDWKALIRKPFFVTENRKIDDLLKDFQEKKVHLAMVVDEYGGTSGIVTLEDVLEEIVGDITDEFDNDELIYTKIDDNTYLFEGKTSLVDFMKVLELDEKEVEFDSKVAETLGGLIVEIAGRILKNNEFIEIADVKMIVESSDKRRIKMVKVIKSVSEE
jgi:gliding motility-associated protein GldE